MSKPMTANERHAAKLAGDPDPDAKTAEAALEAQAAKRKPASKQVGESSARLKRVGGSDRDSFNTELANSVVHTAWVTSAEEAEKAREFTINALIGIGPQDELEGMLAAQMVAAHQASIECFRRAMIENNSVEGRAMNLAQGNKASRTYATLLEALNKHRGKGQQRVTVEHVHVHEGGQAIVGNVAGRGGRGQRESQGQSDAAERQAVIANAPQPFAPMWGEDQERQPVPVAGDAERSLPHARRNKSGCSEG